MLSLVHTFLAATHYCDVCLYVQVAITVYFAVILCIYVLGVQAVLETKHHRLGPDVKLQVYNQFTFDEAKPIHYAPPEVPTHSDFKDESSVPPSPIIKKVSHVMANFLQKCTPSIGKHLEELHVTINIDVEDASEVGFIHILPSKGSEEVRNWREECDAKIASFFKDLDSSSLSVQPELLPKVKEIIEESSSGTSLCIGFAKDDTTLHVAGKSKEVTKFIEEIKHIEDTELTRKDNISLDAKKIIYIEAQLDDLKENHPDVSFEIIPDDNAIIVTGKREDIEVFKKSVKQIKFSSVTVPLSREMLDFLFSVKDHNIVRKLLQDQGDDSCAPYFDQESRELFIVASDKPTANRLAKHLQQSMDYEVIRNPNKATEDKQFLALCDQLEEVNDVYIEILPTEIRIAGRCEHTKAIKQNLEEYIQKKYFGKRKIEVKQGCWRFISQHLRQEWNNITRKLNNTEYEDVMVQFPIITDDNPTILLEGEESLITVLFKEITELIESVCTNDNSPLNLNRPGLLQFLETQNAKLAIKGIEHSVPAYIEVTIKTLETGNETNPTKVINEVCNGATKEGRRVILIKGEIENFRVDVIVNAANVELHHGAGVALAISKRGGPKIQEDSRNFIRANGKLLDGDVVIREVVGDLPCKRIIHAAGPVWQGGTHLEDRMLKRVCTKSLALAAGENYESISFPAISSGRFKFPLNVCANAIIEAFCAWSEEFPHAPLKDIYVVVHDHAVRAFSDAMKKHLTLFPRQHHLPKTSVVSTPSTTPVGKKKKTYKTNTAVSDDVTVTSSLATTMSVTTKSAKLVPIEVHRGELLKQKVNFTIVYLYCILSLATHNKR